MQKLILNSRWKIKELKVTASTNIYIFTFIKKNKKVIKNRTFYFLTFTPEICKLMHII